ncbi:AAA domain-containing protein [Arthrobacter alpinus]|uniref:AAA domain-containing protein n=1 Tax=Arthrobacter alpinus TaxID=656366 RepID=A0A1H5M557_9MICC|nr:AAA family ATPase [Arthrobacter alpinus]SEE83638.1 AAA domain-containing protein [Arthrobacter alpinus]
MSTKITTAELNNFQKVSYAKIEPTGNLVVLAGKNGAGKTSTNDGLEATLTGHNGRNIKRPVKDGHGKASIEVKLSDGSTLIRGYTPSGTTLKGLDAAGNKFGQRELDARISSLGIDGRKFISMGEKDQLKALLSIVDLPFDPAEMDAERKRVFDERANVGRDGKAIGDVVFDKSLPTEETSVAALLEEYRAAEALEQSHRDDRDCLTGAHAEIDRINAEIGNLIALRSTHERDVDSLKEKIGNHAPMPDVPAIRASIDGAEESNAAIRTNNAAIQQAKRQHNLREKYTELTAELGAIDKRKADGLAAAEMPIEGLTFDEEGVLYQGVPFSRASGREQLIVSCAMIMATNPEIRVIVIRDGNVLDMEGMELLTDMAESTDFQIFIEIVKEDKGDEEYFFSDGELA